MAKVNGSSYLIYKETTPGVWLPFGSATSGSLTFDFGVEATTHKGSGGWASNMPTTKRLSGSFDGFSDPTEVLNEVDIQTIISNRQTVKLRRLGFGQGIFYEFFGQIESLTRTMDVESPITYSFNFRSTGEVHQYLKPLRARRVDIFTIELEFAIPVRIVTFNMPARFTVEGVPANSVTLLNPTRLRIVFAASILIFTAINYNYHANMEIRGQHYGLLSTFVNFPITAW